MLRNPYRPLDWRWRRTNELLVGHILDEDDDGAIRSLLQFRRGLKAASDVTQFSNAREQTAAERKFARKHPEMYCAHEIWVKAQFVRYALEALVLAECSAHEIAEECGCGAGVITAYERAFFDIRGRSAKKLLVLEHLIGPAILNGSINMEPDILWKGLALYAGADVLRAQWQLGSRLAPDVRTRLREVMEAEDAKYVISAVAGRRANPYNAHEVIGSWRAAKQVEPLERDEDTASRELAELMKAVSVLVGPTTAAGDLKDEPRATGFVKLLAETSDAVKS